jgi:hypothetical protein
MRASLRSQSAAVGLAVALAVGGGCDWGDLDGVPAGFADGVDDVGGVVALDGLTQSGNDVAVDFDADGVATTVSRSDHRHSDLYDSTETSVALSADGSGDLTATGDLAVAGVVTSGGAAVLTTADEGHGNGIDADTVDGSHASAFAATAHTHTSLAAGDGSTALSAGVTGNLTASDDLNVTGTVAAGGYTFATAPTYYLHLPASAFRRCSTVVTPYYTDVGHSMFLTGVPPGNAADFQAPAYLPQGAVITSIVTYVIDNDADAGDDFTVACWLEGFRPSDRNRVNLGNTSITTSGSSANMQTSAAGGGSPTPVDNQNRSYHVWMKMTLTGNTGVALSFCGVRVGYQWPDVTP